MARRWWRQSDQFEWLSGYLHARELAVPTQRLMAIFFTALALMPFALLRGDDYSTVYLASFSAVAGIIGASCAVWWLRGWPTRSQSLFMIVAGGSVALVSILAADPVLGLISCNGLVVLGGYLAFFHNAKAVLCSTAVAILAGAVCALRLVEAEHATDVAVAGSWVVVEVSAAVPLAIQAVVRTLGADVVRSDHDALTGVLNRRAFYERATTLLTSPGVDLRLIVVMIDLDKFKRLNDTHGHVAGDQALTAVGWALRRENSSSAIIGRAGGEEFVVIDADRADVVESLPTRLCAAISALPQSVTASVGAAVVPYMQTPDPLTAVTELVKIADAAMYRAKRDGGNRAVVQVMNSIFS